MVMTGPQFRIHRSYAVSDKYRGDGSRGTHPGLCVIPLSLTSLVVKQTGSGSSLDVRLARNSWLRIEIGNHAKLGARLGDELERE